MKSLLKKTPCLLNLLICLHFSGFLFSQNGIRSLEIKNEIDSLNEEVWKYVNIDIEQFKSISYNTLRKSQENNYLKGKCYSFQNVGIFYYLTNNQDSSLYYFEKALRYRYTYGDSSLISGTLNNIANVFEKKGKYEDAISSYKKAQLYLNKSTQNKVARLNSNISAIYLRTGDYEKALEFNLKASDILERSLDTLAFGNCLLNRGSIYESMLSYDVAFEFYCRSEELFNEIHDKRHLAKTNNNLGNIMLKQGQFSEAVKFFEYSNLLFSQLESISGQAASEQNLGLAHKFLGEFNESNRYFKKSVKKWKDSKNNQKLAELYVELGILSLDLENAQEALEYFRKSNKLLDYNAKIKFDLYNGLAKSNEKLGNHKAATKYYGLCLQHKDSLSHQQFKWNNLVRINLENNNRIALLEKDRQLEFEKNRKKRIINLVLIFGLFTVSLLFFVYFKFVQSEKRKINTEIRLKVKQKEIESLLKDQELISIRRILEMQEVERRRIAQDLHDRLGSMLSMVKIHFNTSNKTLDVLRNENNNAISKASILIDEACDEVRKIAHDLASGVLKNFGLVAAVQDVKKTLDGAGLFKSEFVTHNMEKRLSSELEIMTFRIIQELIANVIKHAKASEISIQLLRKNRILFLEVSDNGVGFNVNVKSNLASGLGFKNIKSRIYPYNGEIEIDSQLERGTTIFVKIPLKKE